MKEERPDSIDRRLVPASSPPLPDESWKRVPLTTRAELAASSLQVLVAATRIDVEDSLARARGLR